MAWLVRARKWLDEDPDHSTTAQADSEIDVVLVGRVVGHQARFTALDGPLRSKDHVALETTSTDGSGRPTCFSNQHPSPGAAIRRPLDGDDGR